MRPRHVIARAGRTLSALAALALLVACQPDTPPSAPGAPTEPAGGETGPEAPDGAGRGGEGAAPGTVALPGPGARGLWVLAEGSRRVLEDPAKVDRLLADARALGATDLFVQVYRGGRAWYDAQLADRAPFEALVAAGGVDTLAQLIEGAHTSGLRVHAWVNVLSLSLNADAPILAELGREAVLVDRHGRSMLDYPGLEVPPPDGRYYRMGTRGIYLDAAAPGVAERLVATFAELVTRYPGLDGLHLDYIRHPGALPFVPGSRFGVGLDFGYGASSRQRFQQETGLAGPYRDPDEPDARHLVNANAWDDWRRDRVTALVREIASVTRGLRPGLLLSAAVNSYTDRAYLSLAQDWRRWLEDGLIDLAIPMIYTLDDRLFRYQVEHFASAPHHERIWPGVGVWLFARSPGGALAQLDVVRAAGAPGEVLFSYDSIKESPALESELTTAVAARAPVTPGAEADPSAP